MIPALLLILSVVVYRVTTGLLIHSGASWLSNFTPLAGLVQSLTVGLPHYSATHTWMFFRNSLISDLLFTLLFVLCMSVGQSRERSGAGAARFRPAAAG